MESILKQDDIIYSVVEEAEISQELDCSIRHALVECFPADKEAFYHCSWWHSRPSWRILAKTFDEQIIAHVAIITRQIHAGRMRKAINVAGIQSVFVMPSGRGKGISDTLMALAMDEALNRGLDFGILFCIEKLEKVYRRTGWKKIETSVYMSADNGKATNIPDKNITMIYPLKLKDFPEGDIDLAGSDW